ncbi:50S ribosomal protein L17 [Verrucomicrobiota bacterium]
MRHRKKNKKIGRSSAHRHATISALVCALIERKRIKTTVVKAKIARSLAEKMVTLARKGTLSARRQAISVLVRVKHVKILFEEIAPQFNGRQGGYTRITKLAPRRGDCSESAVLEWIGIAPLPKKVKKKKEVEKP